MPSHSHLAAIFDVDGTLVDSRHVIHTAMQRAFTAYGLTPPEYDDTRRIVGLTLHVAIDRLAPRDLGEAAVMELTEHYKQAFVDMRHEPDNHEPLYGGAAELITSLKDEGWALGIATGKSRRGLDAIMETMGWNDIFDAHYCSDDGPGKPDPHMVNANLMSLGVTADRAVTIGDTSFDMIMSKRANVHAIGVDWGFHTRDEISSGGADHIVSTMDDLRGALTRFAARFEG